jgi:Protein of unknown function (DUF2934)
MGLLMTHASTAGRDQRIADIAHKIWEEEGQPEGQAEAHWARATAIVDAEIVTEKPADKKVPTKAKAAPKKK